MTTWTTWRARVCCDAGRNPREGQWSAAPPQYDVRNLRHSPPPAHPSGAGVPIAEFRSALALALLQISVRHAVMAHNTKGTAGHVPRCPAAQGRKASQRLGDGNTNLHVGQGWGQQTRRLLVSA